MIHIRIEGTLLPEYEDGFILDIAMKAIEYMAEGSEIVITTTDGTPPIVLRRDEVPERN